MGCCAYRTQFEQWTQAVPAKQWSSCKNGIICTLFVTNKVKIISNEYIVLSFQQKKIDLKSASKILEQNVNNEKKRKYVLKTKPLEWVCTLSGSEANNKSNDENRSRWLKNEERKRKCHWRRPEYTGPSKWFSTKHEPSSNHGNERNKGILLSARLN